MSDLATFLLARIAEDEAAALKAQEYGGDGVDADTLDAAGPILSDHLRRHDPARVLAECEVKRAIVEKSQEAIAQRDRYSDGQPGFGRIYEGRGALAEHMLGLLALPYADHHDYRAEWAL